MSKFNPIDIKLKNGISVRIREAKVDDAKPLLTCIKTYIPESPFIPKFDLEITLTVDQEKDWISTFLEHENSILLIAEYENLIIGNIDLTGSKRIQMAHTAVVGMGMLESWRNLGLGAKLMQAAINWAKESNSLELLYLQVFTENIAAKSLYEKFGFIEAGVIPNFFKNERQYSDQLTMFLKL